MKKKQIVLLLAVCTLGALTACSSSSGDAGKSVEGATNAAAETESEETAEGTGTEETEKEAAEETAGAEAETVEEVVEEDPGPPRSALTGLEISQEEADADLRPLAVMYPIDRLAQPQYGLDRVQVFYEILEEGEMSRQMGIVQDWQNLDRIGNIRSIRSYFVYEGLEWDPIYIHYGGPTDYCIDILTRHDVDNINGVGGPLGPSYNAYYRINPNGIPTEHTAYTDSDHVNAAIDEAGWSRTHKELYQHGLHFNFVGLDEPVNTLDQYPDAVDATEIDMSDSFPQTQSALSYDEETGLYYKRLYGQPQCDAVSGNQMAFDNIFVKICEYDHHHGGESAYLRVYVSDGPGDGYYITHGKMIHVTWTKDSDYSPNVYVDDNGNPVDVNVGKTMVFIIHKDEDTFLANDVSYGAGHIWGEVPVEEEDESYEESEDYEETEDYEEYSEEESEYEDEPEEGDW